MTRVAARPWHGGASDAYVVLGVVPAVDPTVLQGAVLLTARMHACLVCVWADESHITVDHLPNGSVVTTPLDPDEVDDLDSPTAEDRLYRQLETLLADAPLAWRFRYTTGAPARALHEVAEEIDALAIAIGTRRSGWGHWAAEKVEGSVAVRLVRSQHRPVVLLPRSGSASQPSSASGHL